MKINVSRDLLLEKLLLASHFTSNRLSSSTALQGVLLKGEKNKLHIYSTNLTTYFHTFLSSEEEVSFEIIIDPKKIIEFLNFLNPGAVSFEVKENQLTISQVKTKGNFPLMTTEEFPLPPSTGDKEEKIESKFFLDNLPLLLFTASHDETRPVLTGIDFVNSDNELLMVSTDGFRLSLIKEKATHEIPSMIIPSDFLQEIVKNAKGSAEILFSFSEEEKVARFKIGEDEYFTRLIDGDFPPFEKVMLTESKTKVKVDTAEFLRNVKLISVFARDFSNVIICEFTTEGLSIKPKKEANEENTSFQEIEIEGENQKVAFNFKYLLDLLNHVSEKQVILEILRSDAPVSFKLESNPNFLHIIMPVRVQE